MREKRTNSHFKLAAIAISAIVAFSTLFVILLNPYKIQLSTTKKEVVLLGNYLNSHIIRVHIGKDKKWLQERLKHREFIRFVSSFYNAEQAESIIRDTLDEHRNRLESWVRDQTVTKNMRKSFRKTFTTPVGFGLPRSDINNGQELYSVKVVVQKVNAHSYKIISAYPIPSQRNN